MMKKWLGILGFGAIAGALVYFFLNKKENVDFDKTEAKKDNNAANERDDNTDVELEFVSTKNGNIKEMSERHEDAAQVMKDAVDIICKRSEVAEDENNDLEQISEELDELLKED